MVEQTLPGFCNWVGIEQILWLCSKVVEFLYGIIPNVGCVIILYAVFSHLIFLPFSIKGEIDRRKGQLINEKLRNLKLEFSALSEEEREREDVKESYKKRQEKLKKKKGSTGIGCLVIILRLFILMAVTGAINFMNYKDAVFFLDPSTGAYNFLGFDLLSTPNFSSVLSFIFPFFTAFVIFINGFLSARKNMKDKKALDEKKSPEEREEERRLLAEMGVKENKFPMVYVVQIAFFLLYLYTFSRLKLSLSLYWGMYYALGFGINKLISIIVKKIYKSID